MPISRASSSGGCIRSAPRCVGVEQTGLTNVVAKLLVVALLNPQITGSGRLIDDFPPGQDAAPVAQEVDDEDQDVTV